MCFLTLYIKLGTKKILSSLKWLEADNCLNKILGLLMYFRACYPNYHGRLAKVFWPNTGKMSRFVLSFDCSDTAPIFVNVLTVVVLCQLSNWMCISFSEIFNTVCITVSFD